VAVAIDVTGTPTLSTASVSPHTYTGLTTGVSLSNGAVLFFVFADTHVTGGAATWDGVACTLVASGQTTTTFGRIEIWALSPIGAHTGAKTFSYSWSSGGSVQTEIIGLSFTGVDQTGGVTSFPNGTSATGSSVGTSITVTSAVGDIALAGHVIDVSTFNSVNNTQVLLDNTPNNIGTAANRAAGAATVTLTGTQAATGTWASVGVDVKAGGGAAAVVLWGFEPQTGERLRRPPRIDAAMPAVFGVPQPRSIPWRNAGWEVIPVQPPHRGNEIRAGAIMPKEDGIEAKKINFLGFGWSIILQPPSHPRVERAGSLMSGDPGNQAKFIPPVVVGTPTWEFQQSFQPPSPNLARQRGAGIKGKSEFAIFPNFYPAGWEVAAPMLRRKPAWYSFVGDDGTEGTFTPPVSTTINWGFDGPQLQATARPTAAQRGAVTTGGDSALAAISFTRWVQDAPGYWKQFRRLSMALGIEFLPTPGPTPGWGFDAQALQPPYKPYRSGAWARSEDGTQSPQVNFFPHGWPIAPHQPAHPRPERAGALMAGEPGNEGLYTFIPSFLAPWGYDAQPYQPQHPRPERFAAIMRGDDGSQATRINFFPFGWEVQPVQPQHPTPERRAAAIMPREDGIEQIALRWLNAGWEIAPHQPAHPRPEKAGGIMPVEPGNEGIYSFVTAPFVAHGYDPTAYMPRVRFARAGALARGEDGTEGLYSVRLPLGWQTTEAHVRARRSGVGAFQDNFVPGIPAKLVWTDMAGPPVLPTRRRLLARAKFNIEAKFVFVPPPPVTFVSTPDNLLRRSFSHPGAAIMQFDGGWFQQRYVAVFFATSSITQALAVSAVTQARAETEATQATAVTSTTAASGDTSVTAAAAETVLSGETPGR
jgi:hypothetical protein